MLDFQGFREMFRYVGVRVKGEELYGLYQCLPRREQRGITEKQFREAFGAGAFIRKFTGVIEELKRKGGSWPASPLAFMGLIADKITERKMGQEARTVLIT